MQSKILTCKWLVALFCLTIAFTKPAFAQTCIDDDGDGWGWDPDTNTSCKVVDTTINGGLKLTWTANNSSENVSEYEVAATINDGNQKTVFRGNATTYIARLSAIAANYKDLVCVRVRAIRVTTSGATSEETYSDWSTPSCITLPDAPLQAPQIIELSLIG